MRARRVERSTQPDPWQDDVGSAVLELESTGGEGCDRCRERCVNTHLWALTGSAQRWGGGYFLGRNRLGGGRRGDGFGCGRGGKKLANPLR